MVLFVIGALQNSTANKNSSDKLLPGLLTLTTLSICFNNQKNIFILKLRITFLIKDLLKDLMEMPMLDNQMLNLETG
jgi:hypothetical protein